MKALFAGSFDPFTIGHKDIVDRLSSMFSEIVIGVGCNADKANFGEVSQRVDSIRSIFSANPKVSVKSYEGLTVDFCRSEECDIMIRSVRSLKDFEYERDIAEANRRLSGIETLLLFARPELSHISSSLVRELQRYGKDVSSFLP